MLNFSILLSVSLVGWKLSGDTANTQSKVQSKKEKSVKISKHTGQTITALKARSFYSGDDLTRQCLTKLFGNVQLELLLN